MNKVLGWIVGKVLGKMDGYKTQLGIVLAVVSWLLTVPAFLSAHLPAEVITALTHVKSFLESIGITPASTGAGAGILIPVGVADKVAKDRAEKAAAAAAGPLYEGAPPAGPGTFGRGSH